MREQQLESILSIIVTAVQKDTGEGKYEEDRVIINADYSLVLFLPY